MRQLELCCRSHDVWCLVSDRSIACVIEQFNEKVIQAHCSLILINLNHTYFMRQYNIHCYSLLDINNMYNY